MAHGFRNKELFYHMGLSLVPGVGPVAGKSMIGYCGSAEAVFRESANKLSKIPYVGQISAESVARFNRFDVVENELQFMEENHIEAVHYTSPKYPVRLKQQMDSPLVLFVRGNADLNHSRFVAIVGTRKCTDYGLDITRKIVEGLKAYNVHILSGLAYGIDICAHKSCLENHIPTLAVVGHGLDIIYPGRHVNHARKMVENGGAILSEFFSGTKLNPDYFPRRNRIVAGLCDAVLVVESKIRGGSMITADIASSYNRDVFAIPGRTYDPMSEGCNFLIKNLKAALCENATDIANGMNWDLPDAEKKTKLIQSQLLLSLNDDEKKVADYLSAGEKNYDDILLQTQIPVHKLSVLLLDLEMKGLLKALPGKKYCVTR